MLRLPVDLLSRLPVIGGSDDLLDDVEPGLDATVVVDDGSGPHATAVVASVASGRVWFTTARSAYKCAVLRRNPEIGMLLPRRNGGWVSVHGTANVLDAFRPHESVRALDDVARSGMAAARLLAEHPGDLAGYARRAGSVPLEWLPPQRALVAVAPSRVLVIDDTGEIRHRRGHWSSMLPRPAHADVALPVLVAGPEWVRDRMDTPGEITVGWGADDGLIAMPGRWHGDRADFDVPTSLVQAAGTPSSAPVAVMILSPDREDGPTGKRGLCLRGTGIVVDIAPERSAVSLALERIHWWEGFQSGTLRPR
ncbi:MAG: pyridoxamine 5'-phosphate oxidase family protein [Acidimicrobiia bacterium]